VERKRKLKEGSIKYLDTERKKRSNFTNGRKEHEEDVGA